MDQDLTSADLLRASRTGEPAALGELLVRHLPTLRAFVRLQIGREMRQRESESDLVQSVCRQILEQAERFDFRGENEFKNWLYGAVLNRVQDRRAYYLAQKRDARREELCAWTPDEQDRLRQSYAAFFSPSRAAIASEQQEILERAFDQLPEPQRQVLTLSRIAGLSHAEIAEELDIAETNSRQLLRRAMARVAVILGRDGEGA